MFLWYVFWACRSSDLPQGYWSLKGIDVDSAGSISIDGNQAFVELYGDRWTTHKPVLAEVEKNEEMLWLYFSLETGQGEGTAAIRFQGEEVMLPLGARRGEFEVFFSATQSNEVDTSEWKKKSAISVQKENEYWKQGEFLISTGHDIVGVLTKNYIMVFDEHWYTPVPVVPQRKIKGADWILSFPIEPSFHGELAQIRINLPLRDISVPISRQVDTLDRHLSLVPGSLAIEAREKRISSAKEKANRREEQFVLDQVRNIFSSGTCLELAKSNFGELPIWKGYRLEWHLLANKECALEVEGAPLQHRRHLHRTFTKDDI